MSKREQLEKNVADTKAAYTKVAASAASAATYATYYAADAAYDEWVKAKLELSNYLKEQDDE